jgi:hypothetical protein
MLAPQCAARPWIFVNRDLPRLHCSGETSPLDTRARVLVHFDRHPGLAMGLGSSTRAVEFRLGFGQNHHLQGDGYFDR